MQAHGNLYVKIPHERQCYIRCIHANTSHNRERVHHTDLKLIELSMQYKYNLV